MASWKHIVSSQFFSLPKSLTFNNAIFMMSVWVNEGMKIPLDFIKVL